MNYFVENNHFRYRKVLFYGLCVIFSNLEQGLGVHLKLDNGKVILYSF